MLGYSSLLSAGFNVGWANKTVDLTRLKFPDQFNKSTGFFDAAIPTSVVFDNPSTSYMDIQLGMKYAYFSSQYVFIKGVFSLNHINRPRVNLFTAWHFNIRLSPIDLGIAK